MRKRLLKPVEPFQIFKHATNFVKADEFLRLQAAHKVEIASSAMLLSAFASELLLKCLLVLERTEPTATHRLDVLFRKLSHKRKRRIIELWESGPRQQLVQVGKQMTVPTDLPNALVKCGSAFDQLRYHYERPDMTVFYLGRLPMILIEAIAEIQPDWVRFE